MSAFGLYMEHSFRYYEMDAPLITDAQFDALCSELAAGWNALQHRHKALTTLDALQAGTGHHLKYPKALADLCRKHPDRPLYMVFDMPTFADEHEEKAHRIICTIRYGGVGGSVKADELRRVADIIRGQPKLKLPPPLKMSLPLPPPLRIG